MIDSLKSSEDKTQRITLYWLLLTCSIVVALQLTDVNITILQLSQNAVQINNENDTCPPVLAVIETGNNMGIVTEGQIFWVVSSYYWSLPLSQIFGAWFAHVFGPKLALGLSTVICSFLKCLYPYLIQQNVWSAVAQRFLEGILGGMIRPAIATIVPLWIPMEGRLDFYTFVVGIYFGVGLSYVGYGYLITTFPWETVHYISGIVGMVWATIWFTVASNTPRTNRFISDDEIFYLENKIDYFNVVGLSIPWSYTLTSVPVWAAAITGLGVNIFFSAFIICMPVYFYKCYGLDITEVGIFAGVPFFAAGFFGAPVAYAGRKLTRSYINKLTLIRKCFCAIAYVGCGGLLILLLLIKCNKWYAFAVIVSALGFLSFSIFGTVPALFDLAPNFFGSTYALGTSISVLGTIISPVLMAVLTDHGHSIMGWNNFFITIVALGIASIFPFMIWGSTQTQFWNEYGQSSQQDYDDKLTIVRNLALLERRPVRKVKPADLNEMGVQTEPKTKTGKRKRNQENKKNTTQDKPSTSSTL